MKEATKEQKIGAVEAVLEYYKEMPNSMPGICTLLTRELDCDYQFLNEIFPEFIAMRPIGSKSHWFQQGDNKPRIELLNKLLTQLKGEECIYQVGDTVYDSARYGKGEVVRIDGHLYPFMVKFDNDFESSYTKDGRYDTCCPPTLSFKPYTLDICLERPEPEIKEGTLVYVKGYEENSEWEMRYYHKKNSGGMHCCYFDQKKFGAISPWAFLSLTNPLAND